MTNRDCYYGFNGRVYGSAKAAETARMEAEPRRKPRKHINRKSKLSVCAEVSRDDSEDIRDFQDAQF